MSFNDFNLFQAAFDLKKPLNLLTTQSGSEKQIWNLTSRHTTSLTTTVKNQLLWLKGPLCTKLDIPSFTSIYLKTIINNAAWQKTKNYYELQDPADLFMFLNKIERLMIKEKMKIKPLS